MHIMQTFMTLIRDRDTDEYIESLLACFAAPTIRGLKPGSLINLCRHGDDNITLAWHSEKEELLRKFRLEAFTFPPRPSCDAWERNAVLVLLYRKELLARALFTEEAASILRPLGYDHRASRVESCLERLGERFRENFPHEIGLFLGYPPEDVREFIRNRGRGCLATGYWKVYGDVREAKRAFQRFRRAEYDAARSLIHAKLKSKS
ncbi:MAG: DUF3793 family protein [Synergistaceae bacterium]|jgi:hypothetical protein|nr:DUF3793 family protein [Synergistaceae bacterium]